MEVVLCFLLILFVALYFKIRNNFCYWGEINEGKTRSAAKVKSFKGLGFLLRCE